MVLAILACCLWGTAFWGVKLGLTFMSPLLFAGIRFFGAGLVIFLLRGPRRVAFGIAGNWRTVLICSLLQTVLLYSAFYLSLTMIRGSTGAIINGLGPLVTASLAHLFLPGSRLTFPQFFFLSVAVLGVALLSLEPSLGKDSPWGVVLMGTSLLAGASASVFVGRSSESLDSFVLNSGQLLIGGVTLMGIAFLRGERFPRESLPWQFYGALLWLIGVTSVAFSIWYYLLKVRKAPLSQIAAWRFLIPLVGSLLSWLFLPEDSPSLFSIIGVGVSTLGIYYFFYFTPGRRRSAAPESRFKP